MSKQNGSLPSKVLVALSTIVMIAVNTLAAVGIINGVTTASISDSYPNLFTPAGITFSIWGIIYLGLLVFTVYQFLPLEHTFTPPQQEVMQKVRLAYILSCLINSVWIFVWQYNIIPAAMLLMVCLLVCLTGIALLLRRVDFSTSQALFLRLPFDLYFGWITVASIANATVLLVSLGWNGGGLSPVVWTLAILLVGALIGVATLIRLRSMGYGLVLLWAYFGIYTQHTSASGFARKYPVIITILILCMAAFVLASAFTVFLNRKQSKHSSKRSHL